jgi:hypothetical protein
VTVMNLHNFPHSTVGYSLTAHKLKTDGSPFTCRDCHTLGYVQFDQAVCSSCHARINPTFMQQHAQDFGPACKTCHDGVDSYGHKFNHDTVSFQLIGKHAQVACGQCHINSRSIADLKSAPQDCISCHANVDTHQGRLGTDCGSCHNPAAWTPAKFDHNLSIFKLTGKHISVDCTSCHVNKTYHGTPTDCYTCHEKNDPHNGQFGKTDCGTCHTTDGWSPSTYDHNLSAFQLTGKHINVACASCHVNNVYKGTPSDCNSCHKKDDKHGGQFGSTSCGTCHTTSGWSPSTFDHNLANFKLTGKHVNVSCASCHTNNIYIGTPTDCNSCHAKDDSHGGQFGSMSCGSCHSTSGWTPATFDHNLAAFKLTGKHASIPCTSCHINNVYKGTPTGCNSCHSKDNPHGGQFGSTSCGSCHTTSAWLPSTFNHAGFALSGGHSGLACTQCHSGGVYAGLSTACVSCHAEPAIHAGQFGTNCASCHTINNWNATFNHPNSCGEGGCINHHGASCATCHPANYQTAVCTACHSNNNPGGGD